MKHDFKDFGLCMMSYGVDKETGYPLYLLTRQRFAVVLPRCDGCGETNVLSAPLGTWHKDAKLCYECMLRLQNIRSQRHRFDGMSSEKTLANYIEKVTWYELAEKAGYWVPHDLDKHQRAVAVYGPIIRDKAKKKREMAEQIKTQSYNKDQYCSYCGHRQPVKLLNRDTGRYSCRTCDDRRSRYSSLIKRIDNLTEEETNELHSILDEYVVLMRKGYRTPNIPNIRKKLKQRT